MNSQELIDDLCLRSRAYNLLYALGATPETVRTLEPGEASNLILTAYEVEQGDRSTEQHREIAANVKPYLLRYVTTGRI
jgi:hypothetical protein